MRRPALLSQVLAVNALLVLATVLAASVAARLNLAHDTDLRQFGVLTVAVLTTLLANGLLLRRRFAPLESLVATMERVDLAEPGVRAAPMPDEAQDIARLRAAFNGMLDRLEAERADAAGAVARAQEAERARIARDLHDEVNQALTAVSLRLRASAGSAPPALAAELEETRRLAGQAMRELVGLARELRPTALDDHGLVPALRTLVAELDERGGLRASFAASDDTPLLDPDAQLLVYRIVQEALTNAVRHSGAEHVQVVLEPLAAAAVRVRVTDDGRGFEATRRCPDGLGLRGMRERVRAPGTRLDVRSSPGAGTTIELVVPNAPVQAAA